MRLHVRRSNALLMTLGMFAVAACGNSQAVADAQATEIAAAVFATQTADAPTVTSTPSLTPTPTDTPTPTLTPTPVRECDTGSSPIEVNTTSYGRIEYTTAAYPANCKHYCLWLEDDVRELTISISEFAVDLDLYVGQGDISSVMREDPDDVPWVSNEFGTGQETITIPNAKSDYAYYIEVCSYNGYASYFTMELNAR